MFDRSQTAARLGRREVKTNLKKKRKKNRAEQRTRMFWSSRNLTAADVLPRIGEKVKKPQDADVFVLIFGRIKENGFREIRSMDFFLAGRQKSLAQMN
jgi:hypothetical protein